MQIRTPPDWGPQLAHPTMQMEPTTNMLTEGITMVSKTGKSQFTEVEAAEELGVSVEKLRSLIRSHIVTTDEELSNVAVASFHPSDLLLLKFLSDLGSPMPQH